MPSCLTQCKILNPSDRLKVSPNLCPDSSSLLSPPESPSTLTHYPDSLTVSHYWPQLLFLEEEQNKTSMHLSQDLCTYSSFCLMTLYPDIPPDTQVSSLTSFRPLLIGHLIREVFCDQLSKIKCPHSHQLCDPHSTLSFYSTCARLTYRILICLFITYQ